MIIKKLLNPFPENGQNLLEIKPCPVRLKLYRDLGFNVTAIDNDIDNIDKCKELLPDFDIRYSSIGSFPVQKNEYFNVITFFNVITNMMFEEAKSLILSIGSVLSTDGIIIFTYLDEKNLPLWWEEGDIIQSGRIATKGEFTGELFTIYTEKDLKRILLEFIDLKIEKDNGIMICRARKY